MKEEILFWLAQDVREIYLMDPVFNLNAGRAKEICRFIVEHNQRRVPFHTEVWAEFIDDEMAQLFAAANFAFIEVGLQTTDSAVLELVERRLRMQQFLDGIGFLKKHQLHFELQLIAGLPGETLASFHTSLNFAASLEPPRLAAFDLMILPGTELWRKATAMHIEFDPEPPYHVRAHPTMNRADIAHVAAIAQTAEMLWDYRALQLLARVEGNSYADLVDAWNAWHPGPPTTGQMAARLLEFIGHVCASRGIDPAFFLTFAGMELAHQPQPPALRT